MTFEGAKRQRSEYACSRLTKFRSISCVSLYKSQSLKLLISKQFRNIRKSPIVQANWPMSSHPAAQARPGLMRRRTAEKPTPRISASSFAFRAPWPSSTLLSCEDASRNGCRCFRIGEEQRAEQRRGIDLLARKLCQRDRARMDLKNSAYILWWTAENQRLQQRNKRNTQMT